VKRDAKLKKHPDVEAWENWERSGEGQLCLNGSASGQYLRNRLWKAFMAGRKPDPALRALTDQ
jgi:hypothetical protein